MADDNNNEWNPSFFNQFRTMIGSDEPTNYGAGPSATPGYPPYPGLTPGYPPQPCYPPYPSYPPYPGPTPGLGGFTGPPMSFTGLQNYGGDATVQNQGGDAAVQNQGESTAAPKKVGPAPNREEDDGDEEGGDDGDEEEGDPDPDKWMDFDRNGLPKNPDKISKFITYLEQLARNNISILVMDWRKLQKEDPNKIEWLWNEVKVKIWCLI